MKNTFTIKEALSFAWKKFSEHFWLLVLLILGFVVASALLDKAGRDTPSMILFQFLGVVLSYFATFTLIRFGLAIHKGGKPEWKDIFDFKADHFGYYILGSLLFSLCYLVGFALFIVPGIIVMVRFGFSPFFLIDRNLRPVAAIKESIAATRGEFWHILGFTLLMAVMNVAGVLAFGFGLLVTAPLSFLATIHVYEKLKAKAHAHRVEAPAA